MAPLRRAPAARTLVFMLDPLAFPELLTPAEMSKADRFAISAGTPGIQLMERAGLAVADEAARLTRSRGRIAILCGPGGNGGDGFIAARLLSQRGYAVELGLIGRPEALKGDPALAARYHGPVLAAAAVDLAHADCVIDALFGAGLARDIDGEAKGIIERINAFGHAGGRVLAVDVPSGIDGETGKIRGAAVEASASVTFFRLKPGHLLLPGRTLAGAIRLADIGVPGAALASIGPQTFVNSPPVWSQALPRPNADSHKYARGAALILSGSGHHTGAARLAARAALRAGAGIVSVASPPDAVAINAAQLTAVMVAPFANAREFEALLADERRRAILLGPGAGGGATLRKLVAAALTRPAKQRTIVLDADALTSFAGEAAGLAALIERGGHEAVLTPHEGEFMKLFEGGASPARRRQAHPRPGGGPPYGRRGPDQGGRHGGRRARRPRDHRMGPAALARHRRIGRCALRPRHGPGRPGHGPLRSRFRGGLAARRLRSGGRPGPYRRGPARRVAGGLEGARIGVQHPLPRQSSQANAISAHKRA